MTIYDIAVLTGDLTCPIKRVPKHSLEALDAYLKDFPLEQKCTAVIHHLDRKGKEISKRVFYGTKQELLKQEESKTLV